MHLWTKINVLRLHHVGRGVWLLGFNQPRHGGCRGLPRPPSRDAVFAGVRDPATPSAPAMRTTRATGQGDVAMKKVLLLLVAATLLSSTLGCGCCRRLRDRICRGAFCGSSTATTVPSYVAPAAVPTFVPQASAPVMCAPMAVENCYPVEASCGYDPGCSYDTGYAPSSMTPTMAAPMTIPSTDPQPQ